MRANFLLAAINFQFALDGLAQVFFWPVVICVVLMFGFALLSLGETLIEAGQRWSKPGRILSLDVKPDQSIEAMELQIARQLESLRLCSRIAPMLGLVATMIPLGPALVSMSSGDPTAQTQAVGHSFSVVIIALISASITFAIYTIRRRWLLTELNQWLESNASSEGTS